MLPASRKARITNGKITGFQSAVVLDESTKAVVSKLNVYGNDQGLNLAGGGKHLIEKNYVHDNGRDAIRLGLSSYNRVRLNVVVGNTFGIGVADGSTDNVVDLNSVKRNGDFGIGLFGDVARNLVLANVVDQGPGRASRSTPTRRTRACSRTTSAATGSTASMSSR